MSIWTRLTRYFFPRLVHKIPVASCFQIMQSVYLARALYAAAELGIADLLVRRPMSVAELADATGAQPQSLFRILRALAAVGIFAENEQGRFEMTELAEPMRKDVVGSIRDWLLLTGSRTVWGALAEVDRVVKTGRCGFALAHGDQADLYEFCRHDAAFSGTFVSGMNHWTDWQRDAILSAYDFSTFGTIVDIAGGRGSLMIGMLRRHPKSQGVLFDQPQTVEMARSDVLAAGVLDRCRLVGGSFLEEVPSAGDAYLLKHVLRDWDDATARKILHNVHRAMDAKSVLLIIDAIVDPRNSEDQVVKLLDLEQMFWLNGRLRTLDEWKQLLSETGFQIQSTVKTEVIDAVIIQATRI